MRNFNTVNNNINHRANGKTAMSQVNRTPTLNKALRVADASEVLNKSFGGKYSNKST